MARKFVCGHSQLILNGSAGPENFETTAIPWWNQLVVSSGVTGGGGGGGRDFPPGKFWRLIGKNEAGKKGKQWKMLRKNGKKKNEN